MAVEQRNTGWRVYSRRGCHLCEELINELLPLVRGRHDVEIVDIDSDPDLCEAYGTRIPVVEANGQEICQYTLDRERITQLLDETEPA